MSRSISGNIARLYLIKIAKWFMLYMPFVVPFYSQNGYGMKEVLLLQGIYSVTIVVLEIPSGYFADVLGRKKTLIIGAFMGFVGFLTYSLSGGIWGFLLAEIILGIGQSLISGADSALLYDSLLDMKKEKEYIKYEGRITSLGNIAEAVAGIVGGLLAGLALRAPYIGQTGVAFLAIPAALTLVEPIRHKTMEIIKFRDIFKIVKYSLWENKMLLRNIYFSALIGTATLTMAWFAQPIFQRMELPIEWFGFLWSALNLTVGFAAALAHRIESRMGEIRSILLIGILIPLGYLFAGPIHGYFALVVLFMFYIIRGFATPVLKDYVNRMADSARRATILSVRNFIIRLNFAFVGPFLGWYTDKFTLQQALILAGLIFLVISLFTLTLFILSLKAAKSQQ